MSTSNSTTYRQYSFGRFTLDIDRGSLSADGEDIRLRPKSFQLLLYLVERHGRLVSKDDIFDHVWGRKAVTDDAVSQCLVDIRRALEDRSQNMIRTIPRRGYIFDASVTTGEAANPVPTARRGTRLSNVSRWIFAAVVLLVIGVSAVLWIEDWRSIDVPTMADASSGQKSYSIAVLPFLDLSAGQDLGYFAEGVSEEILNSLARVDSLRVIARTSSFSFKGQGADIATIAQKLDVTHVLEGSVRLSDDTIRVTAQLIDAANSEHVWSATYDRKLGEVFVLQDEIAAEVLERLTSSLSISMPKARQADPEAYRLFLQAVHINGQPYVGRAAEVEQMLRRSLALDPNFAPAWRELGRVLWRRIGDGPMVEEDIAEALAAIEKALEIDPGDAAALAYMGWHIADFDGRLEEGARLFERALSSEPSNEQVAGMAALFALAIDRPEVAVRIGKFGVSRNPLCYACYLSLARSYQYAGRLEDAESTYRAIQTLFDGSSGNVGMILILRGLPEQALTALSEEPVERYRLLGETLALHSLGRTDESAAALARYLDAGGDEQSWGVSVAFAWTGRIDEAFAAIHKTARQRQLYVGERVVRWSLQSISVAVRNPLLRALHDDPRWEEFLDKYGISTDRLAEIDFNVNLPDQG